ncbi:MAG: LptF/LptG family permease [Planctomycetota bacterium]
MTQIDRYLLSLFLRMIGVCFASVAGIFVVFHAFGNLNSLVDLAAQRNSSLIAVAASFYGPYLLWLFDMTGAMIALMALLCAAAWVRRTGELTALLAAGVSHGRILRPLVIAAASLVILQCLSREFILPRLRAHLALTADLTGDAPQPILPNYDYVNELLLDGESIRPSSKLIVRPSIHIEADYGVFGELLLAESGQWMPANAVHPEGYLLSGVSLPENIDQLGSVAVGDRPVLMTSNDQPWIEPDCCFVATTVNTEILQTNQTATRFSSSAQLIRRLRNPAVHNSTSTRVLLHERLIRVPLDFSLFLLGLPLVANRKNHNLFMTAASAMGTIIVFFLIKTAASKMGGGGYLLAPAVAAWAPLVLLGPIAYMRLREVETV